MPTIHWTNKNWKRRLIDEQQELENRIKKLKEFMETPKYKTFDDLYRRKFEMQLYHMSQLHEILYWRIEQIIDFTKFKELRNEYEEISIKVQTLQFEHMDDSFETTPYSVLEEIRDLSVKKEEIQSKLNAMTYIGEEK